MMEYFDFPSIERLDRIRWVYDPDMKDYYMQGLFVYSDPEIQSEWVDIYVKYLGGAGLVEGSPFIDQSNSPILRQYVRTYGDNLNISGVMAMMSQSNRLLSLRALGEYFHVLTNYKYTNFSYVIGGIYTGEYAHVNTNYFCNVDKDMYNQNGQILIKWDYGWQLGGSKPGYINAIPASMIYMRYPEAFAAGQVVPVSSDYTYSGNTFLTYGTLKMETLFSTASENHWNTSLVIMGDDYEVTRNDEVISGGGSGGSVDDAINDGSLGTGEGSGTVLVERPLLFRKFPFSIPFDLSDILAGFKAAPRAPVFIFPFSAFGGGVDATLDFSAFDEVARVVRIGELVLFVFALIASGSKMLGFSFGGGD
jgi:hypothetical protein